MKGKSLSHVQRSVTPWTAAYQAPLSMGFSRQEYWSGVPLPSPWVALAFGIKSKNIIKICDKEFIAYVFFSFIVSGLTKSSTNLS